MAMGVNGLHLSPGSGEGVELLVSQCLCPPDG